MPDPTTPATPADARPSRWPLWLGLACLAVAAAPFLQRGMSAWQTNEVLRKIVSGFLEDVASGRKESALAQLSDEYRSAILSRESATADPPWQPSEKFSSRILSVRQSSASAEVQITLAKSGFTLKPTVHLRRQPDQSWRITRIDNVSVDPHWTRWQEQELHAADESLAKELAEKLTGSQIK